MLATLAQVITPTAAQERLGGNGAAGLVTG